VVITPHAGAKELRPLEFSQGRVYRSPDKTLKEKDPSPDGRGIPVPATAKWSQAAIAIQIVAAPAMARQDLALPVARQIRADERVNYRPRLPPTHF
jgi:hypothetical protein